MDILRLLPDDEYQAAVGANAPTALNPFATIADLIPDTDTNIYNTDNSLTGNRIVTGAGSSLTFNAIAQLTINPTATTNAKITWSDGAGTPTTIVSGAGLNPTGFESASGVASYLASPGVKGYGGLYDNATNTTAQWTVYDSAFGTDEAGFFAGNTTGGGNFTYATLYHSEYATGNFYGFQANVFGERIMSQSAGLNFVPVMSPVNGLAFLSGAGGTGYIGVTNQAGFINWMGASWPAHPVITNDIIPRGDGTTVEDGTWSNVGNDIYPVTTGSNIGDATHRIGTMYMSSVIDYSTDLNLASGGTNQFIFGTDGRLTSTNYNDVIVSGTPIWDVSANITERSGGDGFQVYSFASTFAGAAASNHYRTLYSVAPKGGVNPFGGRYGLYGDAFFTLGAGDDIGVGTYGRAAHSTTRQYGGFFEVIGQPATSQNRAVYANVSASGGASTGPVQVGYFQGGTSVAAHTGAFTGVEGFVFRSGAAIGIGTNIGGEFSAAGASTNMAIRVQAGRGSVVFGTNAPAANTKLTVRGTGSTNATRTLLLESSAGNDRFIVNDDGQQAWGIGANATPNAQFGHIANVANYNFGFGFYTTNCPTAGVTIQMGGTTRKGLTVATQNAPVGGTVVAIEGNSLGNASANNYGVNGLARNGSSTSVGVLGTVAGGATVTPSLYVAAVAGSAGTNVDALQYAGYFVSNSAFAGVKTKDLIGVFGSAGNSTIASGSTSKAIGGQFRTTTIGGGGGAAINGNMALNVPLTSNDGNIVFGANASSVNASLVEVTGDIEIIGAGGGNGLILEAPDTTRYRVTINNAGALVIAAA